MGDGWAEISEPGNQWQDFSVAFAIQPDDGILVLASYRRTMGGVLITSLYRIKP